MSEEVQVRTVGGRREYDGLFELAAAFVGSATRLFLSVSTVPLILLPKDARRRVRRAMVEVARAVVALPKELSDVSVRVADEMFEGGTPTVNLPSIGAMVDTARGFTTRLSRAAEEFGASLGRMSKDAVDATEKAAAKVDEWVEKK